MLFIFNEKCHKNSMLGTLRITKWTFLRILKNKQTNNIWEEETFAGAKHGISCSPFFSQIKK